MKVFLLHHIHMIDEEEDVKMIGIYSSHDAAVQAIVRMKAKPGFCDTPDGFEISEYVVDKDYWEEGYVTVLPQSGDGINDE